MNITNNISKESLFDVVEKPIIEYLETVSGLNRNQFLSVTDVNFKELKFIMGPIPEYNPSKYLLCTLKPVPHTYTTSIPEEISNSKKFIECITLLYTAVRDANASILIDNNLNNEIKDEFLKKYSLYLVMDDTNIVFRPYYIHPSMVRLNSAINLRTIILNEISNLEKNESINKDKICELSEQYTKISDLIISLEKTIKDTEDIQVSRNKELINELGLAIVLEEIDASEINNNTLI